MSERFKTKWGRLPKRLQLTYFLIIAVTAIGIATFVTLFGLGQITPKAAVGQASLSIWTGEQNYDINSVFSLYIQLGADKAEQIGKIQISSLTYDPNYVSVEKTNGAFQLIPSALSNMQVVNSTVEVDGAGNQIGKIDLSFDHIGQSYYNSGSSRLAVINFRSLKSGQASFSFDPYNTQTGSGAYIYNSNGSNILTSFSGWMIMLGPLPTPTPTPATPTPAINPTPTPTPRTTPTQQSNRTPRPTPSSNNSVSEETAIVSETPTPTLSEEAIESVPIPVKVSGFSSTLSILLYIGIAIILTVGIFLVWVFYRDKKSGGKLDEDEII